MSMKTQADAFGMEKQKKVLEQIEERGLYGVLKDHVTCGNTKVSDSTMIFNIGSAKDCPNINTERCQVTTEDSNDCYARKAEKRYPRPLDYRRRQTELWDLTSPTKFAETLKEIIKNKRNNIDYLRLNESGDFRNNIDIRKAEKIAKELKEIGVKTYTYSASSHLSAWDETDALVVNASNDQFGDGVTREFKAVESKEDINEGEVHCPYQASGSEGSSEKDIKCGNGCNACMTKNVGDINVVIH